MATSMSSMTLVTSWGQITVSFAEGCVSACDLPALKQPMKTLRLGRADVRRVAPADRHAARLSEHYLRGLFTGQPSERPPVKQPPGTALQQAVWAALLGIPRGRMETYGSLARRIGRPRAARAIGQACGANPVPLFIPCHRVIAANGSLGGFSSGLAWKEYLLDVEAIPVAGEVRP